MKLFTPITLENFYRHHPNTNLLRDRTGAPLHKDLNFQRFHEINLPVMQQLDRALGTERRVAWVLGSVKDFAIIHQFSISARLNRLVAARIHLRWLVDRQQRNVDGHLIEAG